MKYGLVIIYLILFSKDISAQDPIIYSPSKLLDNISIDCYVDSTKISLLEIEIGDDHFPVLYQFGYDFDELDSFHLLIPEFRPLRILQVAADSIILLGRLKNDSCSSLAAIISYNFNINTYTILSSIPFCDKNIQNLRILIGLNNDKLIQGYYVNIGWNGFVLSVDSNYMLKKLVDSIGHLFVTIDFSRNGYLLKDDDLCYYYDKDFNYIKQKYNFIAGPTQLHQSHIPYGSNYILENFGGSIDYEDYGHHIRIIDSNLRIQNSLIIPIAIEDYVGEISPPFFGGLSGLFDSVFWMAGNNNITSDLNRSTYISLSKVDSNLDVICTQYFGFDAFYRLFGITALPSGGLAAYGTKFNQTYDPFLIVIGKDCELPTVSVNNQNGGPNGILVFPNPASNTISFDCVGFDPESLTVEVFDLQGRIIFSQKDLRKEIHVTDFVPGQYFYRLLDKNGIIGIGSWVKD